MEPVYILDAIRTPIGKFNGSFKSIESYQLGSEVIKSLTTRNKLTPDQVIFGQVLTAGLKQNPVRNASITGNLSENIPAYGVSLVCGSGLKSIQIARNEIACKECDVIIAGGQESMSKARHACFLREGQRYGDMKLEDTLFVDGLTDCFQGYTMGVTAENIAEIYKITREEQDEFSVNSHKKAVEAVNNGSFKSEIIPVDNIDTDEQPRIQDKNRLARQKPYWKTDGTGTVTPGNASTLNDGAAAVLLISESKLKTVNLERSNCESIPELKPLAKILGQTTVGNDPKVMGLAPIKSVKKLLDKLDWTVDNVDLFELNEAFAVQSIACCKELGICEEKVNVNGGAIALGHPIGCSGARILVTLVHALINRRKRYGIASLCIGGGQSVAMAVENMRL